jgi:hypothetical protein
VLFLGIARRRRDVFAGDERVGHSINRAISGAWESACREALRRKCYQPPPEEDYGGGDVCSLEETTSTEDVRLSFRLLRRPPLVEVAF